MKSFISYLVVGLLGVSAITAQDEASGDKWAGVLSIKEVEVAPVPVKQDAPVIPSELKGITAMVHLKFVIDQEGNVAEVLVVKTTDERFDNIAMETVKKWKFKPAMNVGVPIPVRAMVPIRFMAEG